MRHSIVRRNLYDYATDELMDVERRKIQQHLTTCKKCSSELTDLQATLRIVPQHFLNPSDARPGTYWQLFTGKVERRINAPQQASSHVSLLDSFISLFSRRNQFVVGFASAMGLVVIVFSLWRISLPSPVVDTIAERSYQPKGGTFQTASLETKTYDYLERSKLLLVGLVNVDAEVLRSSRMNLTRQKEISKDLIRESRELSASLNGPSQLRLKRLVGDLEVIMLQIANLEAEHDSPGVEIVKSGIERRGILLKINLAEIERGERALTASRRSF